MKTINTLLALLFVITATAATPDFNGTLSGIPVSAFATNPPNWFSYADGNGNVHTTNSSTTKTPAILGADGSMTFQGPVTNQGASFVSGGMTSSGFTNQGANYFIGSSMQYSNGNATNGQILYIGHTAGPSSPFGGVRGVAGGNGVLVRDGSSTGIPSLANVIPGPYSILLFGFQIGANWSLMATNILTSESAMFDQPQQADAIRQGMLHPFLSVDTDDSRADVTNMFYIQSNYLYSVQVANYFRTSGITAALTSVGSKPYFIGDGGWQATSRGTSGELQPLPGSFQGGLSNICYEMGTNGMGMVLAYYFDPTEPNVGDNCMRCDFSGNNIMSYPSGNTATGAYTFPMGTPSTAHLDVKWLYTNGVSGLVVQDISGATDAGYHQRDAEYADAILYLNTKNYGRVYWRNYANFGSGLDSDGPVSDLTYYDGVGGTNSYLPAQMILGMYHDHQNTEEQYYQNFFTGNSTPGFGGADVGIKLGLNDFALWDGTISNWNKGVFPWFPLVPASIATPGYYSNHLACLGMLNACIEQTMTTNMFGAGGALYGGWDTNLTPIVKSTGWLSVWSDPEHYMRIIYFNGTNTLRIRQYGNQGAYVVLAANNSGSTTNINSSICSVDNSPVGSIGLTTNVIYAATNVWTGGFIGYVTNNFITNLPSGTITWQTLTPYTFPLLSATTINAQTITTTGSGGTWSVPSGSISGSIVTATTNLYAPGVVGNGSVTLLTNAVTGEHTFIDDNHPTSASVIVTTVFGSTFSPAGVPQYLFAITNLQGVDTNLEKGFNFANLNNDSANQLLFSSLFCTNFTTNSAQIWADTTISVTSSTNKYCLTRIPK